ncbi:hypothetical protein [Legionella gresilensis]|nr:hypothetical protein [Legionella gresilensis]
MDSSKIQAIKRMHQDKALAIADISKVPNISKPTLYPYLAS